LFFLVIYSAGLTAHEMWVEQKNGMFQLNYGHLFDANDGASSITYNPADLSGILCSFNGALTPLKGEVIAEKISVKGVCDTILFQLRPIHYTKTPYGTVKKKKNEAQHPVRSWISIESVKRIDSLKSPDIHKPIGQSLEITLLDDSSHIKPRDKLTFSVTENGRKIAGAVVSINGETRGATDHNGNVNIRIRENGNQIVQVSVKTPSENTEESDETIKTAALHFITGEK